MAKQEECTQCKNAKVNNRFREVHCSYYGRTPQIDNQPCSHFSGGQQADDQSSSHFSGNIQRCPKCGQEIPKTSSTCSHCGHPLQQDTTSFFSRSPLNQLSTEKKQQPAWLWILIAIVSLLLLGGIVFGFVKGTSAQTKNKLVGTWVYAGGIYAYVTFADNNTFFIDGTFSGHYEIDGGDIIVFYSDGDSNNLRIANDGCLYVEDGSRFVKISDNVNSKQESNKDKEKGGAQYKSIDDVLLEMQMGNYYMEEINTQRELKALEYNIQREVNSIVYNTQREINSTMNSLERDLNSIKYSL